MHTYRNLLQGAVIAYWVIMMERGDNWNIVKVTNGNSDSDGSSGNDGIL